MSDSKEQAVPQPPMPPTPPPPSLLRQVLAPNPQPQFNINQVVGGVGALKKQKPRIQHATSKDELDALNDRLEREDFTFRVESLKDLELARAAAGIDPANLPAIDFDRFVENLLHRLKLGTYGDGDDVDEVAQQNYADRVRNRLANLIPEAKKKILATPLTFDDCEHLNGGKPPASDEALAKKIADAYAFGELKVPLPGLPDEATVEQGGVIRVERMAAFGFELVDQLKSLNCKPELTGSVVLSSKGYTGTPDDLDINVTTSGSTNERDEAWRAIQSALGEVDGVDLPEIRIFALAPGRLHTDNPRIWSRKYGYGLKIEGKYKVLAFMVEIKDVGGKEWQEHLNGTVDRTVGDDNASQPQWLLLDCMTRVLGHRRSMDEAAKSPDMQRLTDVTPGKEREVWRRMVVDDGLTISRSKKLWEKINTAASNLPKDFETRDWLVETVKDHRSYWELFGLADDVSKYETWLSRMH